MITRRSFLRLTGTSALAGSMHVALNGLAFAHAAPTKAEPPAPLGRITIWGVEVYAEASTKSKLLRTAARDDLINLYAQLVGEAVLPHNAIWFQTDGGFCYSSFVQPVFNKPSVVETEPAKKRFWASVCVPFTDAYVAPDKTAKVNMRLYYSSVYRVVGAVQATENNASTKAESRWWYRLAEGISGGTAAFVPATDLKQILPEELTSLAPDAKDKRIDIDRDKCVLTAYEGKNVVLTSRVAIGEGKLYTPRGNYRVIYKAPTQRMSGGWGADFYDLPGVPFPTFFTERGIAIHGAYWHNDFGRARSHGCVNVPPAVAQWVWRWTQPNASYDSYQTFSMGEPTKINVF